MTLDPSGLVGVADDRGQPAAIVTLLFTDLVGSTELLERLGDDAAERLRREHFGLLRSATQRHNGHEVKNLGDGMMTVFTSAVDAVACAVAIQRSVIKRNHRASDRLEIRIGLHVGEPIRDEADYFGTPVVVAKRLCDRAGAGQIFVSAVVRELVGTRGSFSFTDIGPLTLKGLSGPLRAYEVDLGAGELTATSRPLPPALAATHWAPFVGRDRELEGILDAWQRAQSGRAEVVFLAGEPGIGKTRLAGEVVRRVHGDGATVFFGRCYEEPLAPYQPFLEAFSEYVTHADAEEIADVVECNGGALLRLVPQLAERGRSRPALGPADAESERYRLFDAVAGLFARASASAPVVFYVDDLHWADKPTLLLLRHLVRSASSWPILVLATYRDTDVDRRHPLTQLVADLRREATFHRIALSGLGATEVVDLLVALRGDDLDAHERELAAELRTHTEGHPLFLTEMLRELADTGVLSRLEGRWALTGDTASLGVPEGVKELIGRRFGHLSAAGLRALEVAAVIGREFEVDLLDAVVDMNEDDLLDLLDDTARTGLVVEVPNRPGVYAFSHALVRAALCDDLSGARQARLHLRVARALEGRRDPAGALRVGELAHHYLAAESLADPGKAVEYSVLAAEQARRQLAFEEACSHYEHALTALGRAPLDLGRRCEVVLALGESRWETGEFATARRLFREAADVAERLGNRDFLARAALGYSGDLGFQVAVPDDELVMLLERALASPGPDDPVLRARVLARLAETLTLSDPTGRNVRLAKEAIGLARECGAPESVLVGAALALFSPDNAAERLAIGAEVVQAAAASGVHTEVEGHFTRAVTFVEEADLDAADAEIRDCERLARDYPAPYIRFCVELLHVLRASVDSSMADLEARIRSCFETGGGVRNSLAIQMFAVNIFVVHRELGRVAELRAGTRDFADLFPDNHSYAASMAFLYAEMGRLDDARIELDRLAGDGTFSHLRKDVVWLTTMARLAETCVLLDHAEYARALYRLLAPYEDKVLLVGGLLACGGSVRRYLGLLAATAGDQDLAAAHFERAHEVHRRLGARPHLARALLDHARSLARTKGPDRAALTGMATEARELASGLGMTKLVEEATEFLSGVSAQVPATEGRFRAAAARVAGDTRAKLSTRGRSAFARFIKDSPDADLVRRFGSPFIQRALFSALVHSYQPRMRFGFAGEVELCLVDDAEATDPEVFTWTIDVAPRRAAARRGKATAPAVSVRTSVATFLRMFAGELNLVGAALRGDVEIDGDLLVASRLVEMFGGVAPADVLGADIGDRLVYQPEGAVL